MESGRAFDQIAGEYDDTFTQTLIGRAQREQVYGFINQILEKPDIQQILEVNCGTGVDACWFAQQGKTVLASDISPQMISTAEQNKQQLDGDLQSKLEFKVRSADQIEGLTPPGSVDLVFSNFGGLNCLSPNQFRFFFPQANKLLRPGGYLALVIMGRFCWWESLYFLTKLRLKKVFRRLNRKAIPAQLDETTFVDTWYYSPDDCLEIADGFQLTALKPIGFWLPPSYLEPFFQQRPTSIRVLSRLEKQFSHWRWPSYAADHYYLVLQKTSDSN